MNDGREHLNDPVTWGRLLIEAGDHDPLYIALDGSQMNRPQLYRWLLAYWLCYHPGAASLISERQGIDYWDMLYVAAHNKEPCPWHATGRWPRAPERRHWRGEKAVQAVDALMRRYGNEPENMVRGLLTACRDRGAMEGEYNDLHKIVLTHPQFGPWIAFKAVDMVERVIGQPVRFPIDVAMYKEPAEGARIAAPLMGLDTPLEAVKHLLSAYSRMLAPPRRDRFVNVQEVETVLCKWKSARNGHYFIGKDTIALAHDLKGWGPTADLIARKVPSPRS